MKIFITILCIGFVTPIIGEEEAVSIQRELQKNNQIIKQKKKQERSILKELGTLRKNIYLTQKQLNRAYRKYNSYHQQIKDTQTKLTQKEHELRQTKEYLNEKILALYKQQNRPVIQMVFNSD